MGNYRFDVRSKQQFIKDIKSSHICEAEIAVRLCILYHKSTNKWPKLEPHGSDMSGNFIVSETDVSHSPDFIIDSQLVEITRADVICNRNFHEKESKIHHCLTNQYDLVFVNGFKAVKTPNFIRLTYKEVEKFTEMAKEKYGNVLHPGAKNTGPINKAAYRYDIEWFNDLWQVLPIITSDIPNSYKRFLKSCH